MKAIYRDVACAELLNKKFEVPEHKIRTFKKTPEEIKDYERSKKILIQSAEKENKERIINGRN